MAIIIAGGTSSAQQYEIVRSTYEGGLNGLNNHGDYSIHFITGGRYMHRGGVDYLIQSPTALPFTFGTLLGVSDSGIGYGRVSAGGNATRAALWTPEGGWDIMPAGLYQTEARGVTASGRVLITGRDQPGPFLRPAWWQPGQFPEEIFLSSSAANCNQAGDAVFSNSSYIMRSDGTVSELLVDGVSPLINPGINSSGFVAGAVSLPAGFRGVIFNRMGQVVNLVPMNSPLGGFYDLNDSMDAVGRLGGDDSDGAILYSHTLGVRRLSSLLSPSHAGWTFSGASEINNRGQIIAIGKPPGTTTTYSVLLNPVPEPASLTALGMGMLALLRRRQMVKS